MSRMDKYFRWKNKNIETKVTKNNLEETLDNLNKLIKPISFISMIIGSMYLFVYLFHIQYLPKLSWESLIILSLTYFIIGLFISIILLIIIIYPAELTYQSFYVPTNNKKPFKKIILLPITISIALIFFVYAISLVLVFFFKNSLNIVTIFSIGIIIFVLDVLYIKFKVINDNKNKILLIILKFFVLQILSIYEFSIPITKLLKLGNYNATLYIINPQLCKNLYLKTNKQNICIADKNKTKILWSFGEKYLIEVNNTRYKIPEKFILSESIPIPKKNNSKSNKNPSSNASKNKKNKESNKHF